MLIKILEYITNLWYSIVRMVGKIDGDIMNKSISILDVAKFLICKFNNDNRDITQLQLQKLLYFIEAYYMVKYDKSRLYNEEFYAWMYGPVCKEVYNKYRYFMNYPIVETECENLNIDDEDIVNSVNEIYENFGNFSATDLIKLTHMNDSPWFNTYKNSNSPISKKATKEWFKRFFIYESK